MDSAGQRPGGHPAAQKYTITGNFDEHLTMEDSAPSVTLLTRAGAKLISPKATTT